MMMGWLDACKHDQDEYARRYKRASLFYGISGVDKPSVICTILE